MNVARLSRNEVAHTRWIDLSNGTSSIEVLGTTAITEGERDQPLAAGIRRLRVLSDVEPRVERVGGATVVRLEHVTARLASPVVERHGRTITFRLVAPPR